MTTRTRIFCLSISFGVSLFIACGVSLEQNSLRERDVDLARGAKGPALAIIGDSLASGVLASTAMGGDLDRGLVNTLMQTLLSAQSMEAVQGQLSELDKSAAASDQDWALRATIARPLNLTAKDIPLYYAAKWGGSTKNVPSYLEHLTRDYAERGRPAENVLVFIGGNDFCHSEPLEVFQKQYDQSLQDILKLHPKSNVLVALLPPIDDILKYDFVYSPALSCVRMRTSYCKPIFGPDSETIIESYNDIIRRTVQRYRHVYAGKIYLAGSFESMFLTEEDLSFDCFHVSLQGQKKFAEYFEETLARPQID